MLGTFGYLAVLFAGLNLYPVLSSEEPVTLDGRIVVTLVVLALGFAALAFDRWVDVREKQVSVAERSERRTASGPARSTQV